jgi:NAD dependent epimerase/dehydratase family enzyme
MRKIVLAGGSGQVGNLLRRHFAALGDKVIVMTRDTASGNGFIQWDGRTLGDWTMELEGADLVVNLCGRSVNCRYHARNRQIILASRIDTTRILGEAIARTEEAPRVWMNASTATIYRHALDRDMDEQTGELGGDELGIPETWRFSMDVARRWEEAFAEGAHAGDPKNCVAERHDDEPRSRRCL